VLPITPFLHFGSSGGSQTHNLSSYEDAALSLSYTATIAKAEVRFELTHRSFAGISLRPLGYSAIWEP
jgi:hypothetical protein